MRHQIPQMLKQGKGAIVNMASIGRIGEAREVTSAIMWLASDEASFVVGEARQIDDGLGA